MGAARRVDAPGTTTVIDPPTRGHTKRMQRHFGAAVAVAPAAGVTYITFVGFSKFSAAAIAVRGLPSAAAFPPVAGLLMPDAKATDKASSPSARCAASGARFPGFMPLLLGLGGGVG
jgi:5-enolpyruvylshikimate-3-phosphate synthase